MALYAVVEELAWIGLGSCVLAAEGPCQRVQVLALVGQEGRLGLRVFVVLQTVALVASAIELTA